MVNITKNYSIVKPDLDNAADIELVAEAIDMIDETIKTVEEKVDAASAGGMKASDYDADGDGIVDDAKKLGGQLPEHYATKDDVAELADEVEGKAPKSHASSSSTYGVGTSSAYGHVKLANNLTTTTTSGIALNAAQGKILNDKIAEKAPAYSYGTEDLTAGESALETGKLYFVYE